MKRLRLIYCPLSGTTETAGAPQQFRTCCLLRPIRSTPPADYTAVLIEVDRQDSTLGKRAVKGDELLCLAEEVDPGFSSWRLEYLVWLIVLSYDLSSCFAAKRRHEFIV